MAGIYIPNMEMPKEKGAHEIKITLFVREDGTAGLWGKEIYIPHEPLTLIPVPDHGRLIDADAIYRKIKTECNPYGKPTMGFEDGKRVLGIIDNAQTVIPADKEG